MLSPEDLQTSRQDCRLCHSRGCSVCGEPTDYMIIRSHLRDYINPHQRAALAEVWELARRAGPLAPNPYLSEP